MSEKFKQSKAAGPHYQLSRMAGTWSGTAKVWFNPAQEPDVSPVKATMRLILDGRFLLHEYQGSLGGKPLEGLAIYGYHLGLGVHQTAWLDSFHNGSAIMFSQSERGAGQFSVLGSYAYVTPDTEQHWGWRTEVALNGDDEIVITAYNISPEGETFKATETVYQRVPLTGG